MKDTTKQLLAGCGIFLAGMIVGVAMKTKISKTIDTLYEAGGGIYVPVESKQKGVYVNCTVK